MLVVLLILLLLFGIIHPSFPSKLYSYALYLFICMSILYISNLQMFKLYLKCLCH
jgi:hypothetical protein